MTNVHLSKLSLKFMKTLESSNSMTSFDMLMWSLTLEHVSLFHLHSLVGLVVGTETGNLSDFQEVLQLF